MGMQLQVLPMYTKALPQDFDGQHKIIDWPQTSSPAYSYAALELKEIEISLASATT